jgi:hypothetical protein
LRYFSLIFAVIFPFFVWADGNAKAEQSPLTAEEKGKLEKFIHASHLVDCLVTYKFDFFASQVGLTVEGPEKSERELVTQLRNYLKSGKLEQLDLKEKVPKEIAQRCDIIAQTIIELWAIRMQGSGNDSQ